MNNKIPCGGFYLSDTLGVDENGKLGVNGGEPYKSLVTDDEGGVKWEDRLAYESDPVTTEIFKESIFSFKSPVDEGGSYTSEKAWPEEVIPFNVYSVTKIVIVWDSVEYQYDVDSNSIGPDRWIFVGNGAVTNAGLEDTGEPFIAILMDSGVVFLTKSMEESHIISISIVRRALHKIDKKFIPGNRICIGHDENGGELFVESDNPSGIVKVLDSNDEWDKNIIGLNETNYLALQSDVFIIRKVVSAGRIVSSDIPTSVGEKYEAVEDRSNIIKALSSKHQYLIEYGFSFNNGTGISVCSYLSKLGNEHSKFASAVVSAENGMIYSITLKLNSDNKTAKVVLKCIA